jgi:N-succinyldiaminopimelate aminotransferase
MLAGARMHRVSLTPPVYPKDGGIVEDGWQLDIDRLAAVINPNTRLLIINTPHNPTGTVFDKNTLQQIARLAQENDVIVVSDEVYEHLVFDGATHDSIVNLPGMRERTIMISSAGKTFSCTGWKTGWACAPEPLATAVKGIKQFLTYGGGTPLQHGVAAGLMLDDTVFAHEAADLQRRRDYVVDQVSRLGIPVTRSAATYFVTADFAPVGFDDAEAFCRWAPEAIGVAAVPVSTFVADKAPVKSLVRLAVCKADSTLEEGMARLRRGFQKGL